MAVDAAADVLRLLALQQMRHAAGELDHLDAALHRAGGVGQRLAMLFRSQLREFVAVLLHQLAEAGEDARAPQRRGLAPGREGRFGRRHRGIDIVLARQRHLADHLAAGRIEHVAHAAAGRLDALTIDPEMQFHGCHGVSFRTAPHRERRNAKTSV